MNLCTSPVQIFLGHHDAGFSYDGSIEIRLTDNHAVKPLKAMLKLGLIVPG